MIFQRQKLIQIHRHQSKCIYIQKIPAQIKHQCAIKKLPFKIQKMKTPEIYK
jgi:hypothetical protein